MSKDGIGVLAVDLDGTLKTSGRPIEARVKEGLRRLTASGVRLVLVTGRCEPELRQIVEPGMFDATVAENGAMLLFGGGRKTFAPDGWWDERKKMVALFGGGCEEVIIALDRGLEAEVLRAVDASVADVEPNKDRLMILPKGVSKTSGLLAALEALGEPRGRVMCIGDGENDLPMFRLASVKVALENSVDSLKREADYVTQRPDGEGVLEAVDRFVYQKG